MITLPLYVIEKVNNTWELYQTVDCITWTFETKSECEIKLKELCK